MHVSVECVSSQDVTNERSCECLLQLNKVCIESGVEHAVHWTFLVTPTHNDVLTNPTFTPPTLCFLQKFSRIKLGSAWVVHLGGTSSEAQTRGGTS